MSAMTSSRPTWRWGWPAWGAPPPRGGGGLASCPVIGVPTSVGYGASFGGIAALLSMLNSCASGVSVVNIDNGFGPGYQASLNNRQAARDSQAEEQKQPEPRPKVS